MTESIFKTRKLGDIYDEICQVYLSDDRPWILGFSGGKDSTCMIQLIWNALVLPKNKITKKNIHYFNASGIPKNCGNSDEFIRYDGNGREKNWITNINKFGETNC